MSRIRRRKFASSSPASSTCGWPCARPHTGTDRRASLASVRPLVVPPSVAPPIHESQTCTGARRSAGICTLAAAVGRCDLTLRRTLSRRASVAARQRESPASLCWTVHSAADVARALARPQPRTKTTRRQTHTGANSAHAPGHAMSSSPSRSGHPSSSSAPLVAEVRAILHANLDRSMDVVGSGRQPLDEWVKQEEADTKRVQLQEQQQSLRLQASSSSSSPASSSSSVSPLLLFSLFGLQGLPCGLLDSYLHQVLTLVGYSKEVVGLTYWIYLPYNFRWIVAGWIDRKRGRTNAGTSDTDDGNQVETQVLVKLMAMAGLLLAACAFFPVSTSASAVEATRANLPWVYGLLTLVMLLMAIADPAMDAFLLQADEEETHPAVDQEKESDTANPIETSDNGIRATDPASSPSSSSSFLASPPSLPPPPPSDASGNSVQAIAFKFGKWVCTLAVTSMLVHWNVEWTTTLVTMATAYAVIAACMQRVSQRARGNSKAAKSPRPAPAASSSTAASTDSVSFGTIARHCLVAFRTPTGFFLLVLALTNKFGECLAKQMLVAFQAEEFHRAAHATATIGWSLEQREARSSAAVAELFSESQAISLVGSFLPVLVGFLLSRSHLGPTFLFRLRRRLPPFDRLWLHVTTATMVVRMGTLGLMAMAVHAGEPAGIAEAVHTATDANAADGFIRARLGWRVAGGGFAFCSGLSTSLSYIVGLSTVRTLTSSGDPRLHLVHLTVYSLVESADDWTRTVSGGVSGFLLTRLQGDFQMFFAVAAALGLLPIIAAIGLTYATRSRKAHVQAPPDACPPSTRRAKAD